MTPADKIFNRKMKFVLAGVASMDEQARAFQAKIYELILGDYLPLFDIENGLIMDSDKNVALISKLDSVLDKLEGALQKDILGGFAKNILQTASISAEYYVALGFDSTVVGNLLKNKVNLEKRLGITPSGRLNKKGYLYRLGQTNQVRDELKRYVVNSLTGDKPFLEFQLGFKNLVKGSPKGRIKGLSTKGSLQRYFDQFAYDAFNELDETANRQFAQGLNLKHFIFEGDVIKTTRPFCRKRAGKAFKVADALKHWKNDPDLVDKKTKGSYNPLIERGRMRCRHFIKYITETIYKHMNGIK